MGFYEIQGGYKVVQSNEGVAPSKSEGYSFSLHKPIIIKLDALGKSGRERKCIMNFGFIFDFCFVHLFHLYPYHATWDSGHSHLICTQKSSFLLLYAEPRSHSFIIYNRRCAYYATYGPP